MEWARSRLEDVRRIAEVRECAIAKASRIALAAQHLLDNIAGDDIACCVTACRSVNLLQNGVISGSRDLDFAWAEGSKLLGRDHERKTGSDRAGPH